MILVLTRGSSNVILYTENNRVTVTVHIQVKVNYRYAPAWKCPFSWAFDAIVSCSGNQNCSDSDRE